MKHLLLTSLLLLGIHSCCDAVTVSGTVYNDIDGVASGGTNNLSGSNAGGGVNMLLVDGTNIVVAISSVSAGGAYSFTSISSGTYTIRLSTGGTLSASAPQASLPAGWVNTGEGLTGSGDGTPDGNVAITVAAANITADFGIEKTPETAIATQSAQNNPGGTNLLTIPASAFATSTVGTDPNTQDYDGGTVANIRIVTFPSSANSLVINGTTTYTAANFPATGVLVPVNSGTNQPTQTIQIDPVDGNVTSIIYFAAVDNAGKQDPTASSVSVPVQGTSTISGHVYNDANSNLAFTTGEGLSGVDVWLFNVAAGAPNWMIYPVATATTDASGNYSFSNIATGNYQIRVRFSTVPVTPVPTPRTVIDNNVYTADTHADGITILNMTGSTTSYTNIDFGLATNLTPPTFTSAGSFRWNATNTFNAGQNNQLTGTYNLSPKTFGSNSYTPTISWSQDRNTHPPTYGNQYPQAGYNASEVGVFFPGASKGGLHTADTTYGILAGDFGDYDVYPANNSRTTTGIKFSQSVTNIKFSVYDVDASDVIRRGGRIDHVTVIGYYNGAPVIPVITNPSATPWNTISANDITAWPDYDVNNNSFSYNSGNMDKASSNVYFAATVDSIAVQYEEWAPLIVGAKGLLYDGQQMHDSAWSARVPEGRGISIGGIDYSALSLSGTVYHDANGITDALINGTPFNAGGTLYAILVDNSGNVAATTPVASDGTYLLPVATGTYTVRLSTSAGTIGNSAPAASLPANWVNTAEGLIGINPAGDGTANGSISVTVTDVDVAGADFGIEQPPVSDAKSYNVAKTAFSNTPASGYPSLTGYTSIQASSAALTGYAAGGSLTGSDPEDCTTASSCAAGKKFIAISMNSNTLLYYNNGAGATLLSPGDAILNFDASKLVIYGQDNTGTAASPVGFTYKLMDAAGITGSAVSYTITSSTPLAIELLSFTAALAGANVNLHWATGVEKGITSFDVTRSTDGNYFAKIGTVSAHGNNSTYAFTDIQPGGGVFHYRLNANEQDGAPHLSNTETVRIGSNEGTAVTVYPNPTRNVLNIATAKVIGEVSITDVTGRRTILPSPTANGTIDLSTLPAGFYLLELTLDNTEVCRFKIEKL